GEQRVLRLADADPVEIVGQRGLQELRRARALDLELAHVRDVEDAAVGSYRLVLWDDAFVLDRHLPAGERNHPRAEGDVRVVERRPQERLGHATPMLTRLRKVPLRLSLRSEPQPERLTGSWGQPGRMNPRRAPQAYRTRGAVKPLLFVAEERGDVEHVRGHLEPAGCG